MYWLPCCSINRSLSSQLFNSVTGCCSKYLSFLDIVSHVRKTNNEFRLLIAIPQWHEEPCHPNPQFVNNAWTYKKTEFTCNFKMIMNGNSQHKIMVNAFCTYASQLSIYARREWRQNQIIPCALLSYIYKHFWTYFVLCS